MKNPSALLLILSFLFAPGMASAQETSADPASYEACVALVESDAAAALDMAKTLKRQRGEVEAGGSHCEALALMQLGRPAEAGDAFFNLAERLLRADDAMRSDIYAQAGDAWVLGGEYEPAIRAYDNAIARTPDKPDFYEGRARVKALAGKWEGARDDAAEALALDPNFTAAMLIRSAANRTLGYPRAALVDANHAVELNPHSLDALLERGLVHKALGDKASAWGDWSNAVKYAKETGREDDPAALAAAHYLSQ
jgi:tetratricopeptide (TPR) repeat protein